MNDTPIDLPLPGARVLVVDDELQVRSALVRSLSLLGYRADDAASGYEALEKLEHSPYDVMVLDISMPGMGGVEVMQRAHELWPDLIIIILTGHAGLESAISAVRSGVADYLHKPASAFDIATAAADALRQRAEDLRRQRLFQVMHQALAELRGVKASEEPRPAHNRERFLRAGRVTLDLERRTVAMSRAGEADDPKAELTGGEATLLAYMMHRPNAVLSCHELARSALGYDVNEEDAENIVRPHIYRLRHKLEADPREPRLIRTVRGQGYFLAV